MWTFLLLGTKLHPVNYDNPIRKSCDIELISDSSLAVQQACKYKVELSSRSSLLATSSERRGGDKIIQLETKVPLPRNGGTIFLYIGPPVP